MIKKAIAILLAGVMACMFLSGCEIITETFSNDNDQATDASDMDEATWTETMKNKAVEELDGVEHSDIIEWNENYLVYAAVPKVTGCDTVSAEMQSFEQGKVDRFKQEVSEAANTDKSKDKPELSVTYTPYKLKNAVISFKVVTYADTGLTVTDNYINTFVYNMQTQEKMSLDSVFLNDKDYLGAIAKIARERLKQNTVLLENYNEAQFMAGTEPNAQNYSSFVVGDGEIHFYFNRQQIAVNNAGSFEVTLSFGDLQDVLRPEILDPDAAAAAAASASAEAERMANLPAFLQTSGDEMPPFSIEGIDPVNDKVVALTFDDGPNPSTTGKILQALVDNNARATFFVLGSRVAEFPETTKKIYDSGSEIGNHSYNHKDFKKISVEEMLDEVNSTSDAVYKAVGKLPILVRPPYGNIKTELANEIGRACILWTVDSKDWQYKNVDKDYEEVMEHVDNGSVVLMHDIYEATADAAVRIIQELTDRGYKLVTISQLIQIEEARGNEVNIIYPHWGND